MVITNNMKEKEIFDHPDLKLYAKYAMFNHEMGKFLFNKRLKWICKLSGWSEEATLLGLQRLADIAQTKEPFVYRVYPEAERQKDPTKEDVLRIRNTCEIGNKGGHGFGLGLGMDVEGWLERAIHFYEGL